MLYRPTFAQIRQLPRSLKNGDIFTLKRWIQLRGMVYLPYIEAEGFLRSPSPIEKGVEAALKPGYHSWDMIH